VSPDQDNPISVIDLPPGGSPGQPEATLVELVVESAGRYRLLEKLGEGSMGEVWRGEDPEIARPVAIKLLNVPPGLSEDLRSEWDERFLREARAAGRLSHPGIVAVYDVGRTDHGRPFIVMELVEGLSLDAIMKKGSPRSAETALSWGAEVAEALGAAHQRGVVHRDIKPANILIDAAGKARVADFGIARVSESDLTREGVFLGSPAFTSPEQLRGGAADGRSDLFSLASTLYVLLTGVRPFGGKDLTSIAYAVCHVEPDPPTRHAPALPSACDAVLLKALAKDPQRRYQTGAEMAADLRAAARRAPGTNAERAGSIERTVREAAPGPSRSREEIERQAAAFGSSAAVLVVRSASAAWAAARAAGKHAMAALRRTWARGWAKGPRVRFAMVAGVVLLLAALTAGGVALAHRIEESRRETPGRKIKKAFESLFSELDTRPQESAGWEDDRHV